MEGLQRHEDQTIRQRHVCPFIPISTSRPGWTYRHDYRKCSVQNLNPPHMLLYREWRWKAMPHVKCCLPCRVCWRFIVRTHRFCLSLSAQNTSLNLKPLYHRLDMQSRTSCLRIILSSSSWNLILIWESSLAMMVSNRCSFLRWEIARVFIRW